MYGLCNKNDQAQYTLGLGILMKIAVLCPNEPGDIICKFSYTILHMALFWKILWSSWCECNNLWIYLRHQLSCCISFSFRIISFLLQLHCDANVFILHKNLVIFNSIGHEQKAEISGRWGILCNTENLSMSTKKMT